MARPPTGPPGFSSPLQEAIALHQRGKLNPARKIYREVVLRQPGNVDALELLAQAAAELGDFAEAARMLTRAAAIRPDKLEVQFNLGAAERKLNKLPEAEAAFRRAIVISPGSAMIHLQLGQVLNHQGRLPEAADCFQAATEHEPKLADAHFNLGKMLAISGDLYAAVASFARAAELEADKVEPLCELGLVLLSLNRFDKAVEALRHALVIEPKNVFAHVLLGSTFRLQGRLPEAIDVLQRAFQLDKNRVDALFELIIAKRLAADWKDLARLEQTAGRLALRPEASTSTHVLWLVDDPAAHRKAARAVVKFNWPGAQAPAAPAILAAPPELRARSNGPLRIGYFSSDFGDHPVARVIGGFIAAHDRRRVEAHAFHLIADDAKTIRPDYVASFDRWHAVAGKSAGDIVALARSLGIDIAVDLNGHTAGGRPAAFVHRLAPVQVNYLGFPATMGAHQMDYLLADGFVIPPGTDDLYDEKIVRLPGCYLPNDLGREPPGATPTRAANGLPETGLVFAAFNTVNKISPELFSCWMRILATSPASVLWLPALSETVRANLRREAEARGIAADRLVFGPFARERADHIARHALADLFLDCWPYNAHTTAADALWAGLPVLTWAGKAFPSRVAGSLLRVAGLPELITENLADYEATALRLARNPAELAGLKARLVAARTETALFDRRRFARRMEWGFVRMAEISAAGGRPVGFDIPESV